MSLNTSPTTGIKAPQTPLLPGNSLEQTTIISTDSTSLVLPCTIKPPNWFNPN